MVEENLFLAKSINLQVIEESGRFFIKIPSLYLEIKLMQNNTFLGFCYFDILLKTNDKKKVVESEKVKISNLVMQ